MAETGTSEPHVVIDHGQRVCPECGSLCVTRFVDRKFGGCEWVWWCGCGWTSETHREPHRQAAVVNRQLSWKTLNKWHE
jgi:hypothetical protein